jgi:hypothetical protein
MSSTLKKSLLYEPDFRWRATEISRLEGFSDAVFAFAVTLLVVSLEVPKSFTELVAVMKGFVAFGICFAMLVLVWKEHTIYFRRYGLQTPLIVFLNAVLLFLVLLYVYPLKFLFGFVVGQFSHGALSSMPATSEPGITQQQIPSLMVMYGLGLSAVYLVFVLLYIDAYRRRRDLQLDELETFITRRSIYDHAAMMIFGLLSSMLAVTLPLSLVGLSGMVYWLIPVYFTIGGVTLGKRQKLLAEKHANAIHAPAPSNVHASSR